MFGSKDFISALGSDVLQLFSGKKKFLDEEKESKIKDLLQKNLHKLDLISHSEFERTLNSITSLEKRILSLENKIHELEYLKKKDSDE